MAISYYSYTRKFYFPILASTKRARIIEALKIWSDNTCLTFVEYDPADATQENSGLWFYDDNTGCHSIIGRSSSDPWQKVYLADSCMTQVNRSAFYIQFRNVLIPKPMRYYRSSRYQTNGIDLSQFSNDTILLVPIDTKKYPKGWQNY